MGFHLIGNEGLDFLLCASPKNKNLRNSSQQSTWQTKGQIEIEEKNTCIQLFYVSIYF